MSDRTNAIMALVRRLGSSMILDANDLRGEIESAVAALEREIAEATRGVTAQNAVVIAQANKIAALREALQPFMEHPANDGLGDDRALIEACRAARAVLLNKESVKDTSDPDRPTLLAFFTKHALGPLAAPSCMVCGETCLAPAVQHLELPGVVCCRRCKAASEAAKPCNAAGTENG